MIGCSIGVNLTRGGKVYNGPAEFGIAYDEWTIQRPDTMFQVASNGSVPTVALNDPLGEWRSIGSRATLLQQPTAGKRLLLKSDGTRLVPESDGIDDWIGAAAPVDLAQTSILATVGIKNVGNYFNSMTDNGQAHIVFADGGTWAVYGGNYVANGAVPGAGGWATVTLTAVFKGAGSVLRVNGVEKISGDFGSQAQDGLRICAGAGGADNSSMRLYHVVRFEGGLTAAQYQAEELRQRQLWGAY